MTGIFSWGLLQVTQSGVVLSKVVLREVYFEGPNRVWRASKTWDMNGDLGSGPVWSGTWVFTSPYLPSGLGKEGQLKWKRPLRLARRRPLPWPTPSPETSPADCRSFATQHTHQPTTGLTMEKFIGEYFTTLITPYVRSCAHHTTGCSREIACWTPGLCWGIDVCPRLFILLQSEEMPTDGAQKWPAWSAPDETDT